MRVRVASSVDVHAIAQIHVAAWQSTYRGIVPDAYLDELSVTKREESWTTAITRGSPTVLVAEDENELSGWVAFGRCRDADQPERTGELWAIYVSPECVGHGIGRTLWLSARAELVRLGFLRVTLWVLEQNALACRFYLAAGFVPEPCSRKLVEIGGASLQELRYVYSLAA